MSFETFKNQIKADDGIAGARVRKGVQRNKDASPVARPEQIHRTAPEPVVVETEEQLEFDFNGDSDIE